jgi:site-specific recombinase XerD
MRLKTPKYTRSYFDRHGKPRHEFRRAGYRTVALPGLPHSPEYMAAYAKALADTAPIVLGAKKTMAGSVDAALVSYYASQAFAGLADTTKQMRRSLLEIFRAEHGTRNIALMDGRALQVILSKLTPSNQQNLKKALRGLVDHCMSKGWIKTDPLPGLKLTKMKVKGHHTWTPEEVQQFRDHHAPGTRARLSLELLLGSGHSKSDVIRMGRQHIKNGKLSMSRKKTGVPFSIPCLPEMVAEIELHAKDNLTFIVNKRGQPLTAHDFGRRFRGWCDEAGLPQCAAHGLRKASAVRQAMNGATAFELMAWHGWKTIGEAQRYVDEANRIKLAEAAGARIVSGTKTV